MLEVGAITKQVNLNIYQTINERGIHGFCYALLNDRLPAAKTALLPIYYGNNSMKFKLNRIKASPSTQQTNPTWSNKNLPMYSGRIRLIECRSGEIFKDGLLFYA